MNSSIVAQSRAEHIVILGGGFGGWYAAKALAPRLPRARITIVDRLDHLLYTPMLTEVAGGNLRPTDVAVPIRSLPKRINFVQGEVTAIDLPSKRVTLDDGSVLDATQLVIAFGSTTAYHGISGAQEHSFSMKAMADASAVVAEVSRNVSEAQSCADAARRRDLLRLVVAGGGYTGVETVAAVAEHMRRQVEAAGLDPSEMEAVLIEPAGRLMLETPESLAEYSRVYLQSAGVRVILNEGVKEVQGSRVTLTTGESIEAGILIWDTGIEPSPLLKQTKLPLGKHHGVVVDSCFRVQGFDGVWAIGDCAEIPKPGGGTYAPTAQNATREGTHVAVNISAVLHGRQPMPFRFKMLGQLAILSGRRAVAEILGVKIEGFVAWGLWWAIYLVKLPSMAKRAAVLSSLSQGAPEKATG
jgi:NADH dehydrogenase